MFGGRLSFSRSSAVPSNRRRPVGRQYVSGIYPKLSADPNRAHRHDISRALKLTAAGQLLEPPVLDRPCRPARAAARLLAETPTSWSSLPPATTRSWGAMRRRGIAGEPPPDPMSMQQSIARQQPLRRDDGLDNQPVDCRIRRGIELERREVALLVPLAEHIKVRGQPRRLLRRHPRSRQRHTLLNPRGIVVVGHRASIVVRQVRPVRRVRQVQGTS